MGDIDPKILVQNAEAAIGEILYSACDLKDEQKDIQALIEHWKEIPEEQKEGLISRVIKKVDDELLGNVLSPFIESIIDQAIKMIIK